MCTLLLLPFPFSQLRKSVPCHQTELSCGLPCNMNLPCGRHRCILPCHKGPCLKEGQTCTQPCTTPRSLCGHNCAGPCHDGPCPDTPCKEMVCVIWGFHSRDCEECCLLGCDVVWLIRTTWHHIPKDGFLRYVWCLTTDITSMKKVIKDENIF